MDKKHVSQEIWSLQKVNQEIKRGEKGQAGNLKTTCVLAGNKVVEYISEK